MFLPLEEKIRILINKASSFFLFGFILLAGLFLFPEKVKAQQCPTKPSIINFEEQDHGWKVDWQLDEPNPDTWRIEANSTGGSSGKCFGSWTNGFWSGTKRSFTTTDDFCQCRVNIRVCAVKSGCPDSCSDFYLHDFGYCRCVIADIYRDQDSADSVDLSDLIMVGICYGCTPSNCPGGWINGDKCYRADINGDLIVNDADSDIISGCYNTRMCWCPQSPPTPTAPPMPTPTPTPTLTPTPTPYPCSTIYGYIKTPGGAGIGGATINLTKSNNLSCTGGVCASVTSRAIDGYWRANCGGAVTCLRVIETANPPGYQDSSKLPTGPAGSEVWSVNGIVLKNPSVSSCGPFTFYDVPVPTATPTPAPTATPTPTPTCSPSDPSRPNLKSPVNSSILAMTEVTMEWFTVPSWGEDCLPGSNNRYKVYLSSSLSDTTDGDLSNEGGNLKCNVDESTLQCLQTNLINGTVYYWQVEANNGQSHKLSNIWNFLIDLTAGSWWQTKDG